MEHARQTTPFDDVNAILHYFVEGVVPVFWKNLVGMSFMFEKVFQ